MFTVILIAGVSYLLGSIPFGYLLVRIFRGEDVRRSGSGNIGATNVARKSPALGAITLLLDAAKGAAAVVLADTTMRFQLMSGTPSVAARYVAAESITEAARSWLMAWFALAALFAIIGHMFPIWLKFRGGKGVATALGSFALIAPKAALVAAAIFVVIVLIFRYVSLGSIIAVAAFPLLAWAFREYGGTVAALAFMSLSSLLIVFKHRSNIRRLLAGTENRFGSQRNQSSPATKSEQS
jgi:acyl phosphate:glycerol-3-phosphate acyltransferase